jgi:hypothetical protein
MRSFGGFKRNGEIVYGEIRNEEIHLLAKPFWLGIEPTGEIVPLRELQIHVPVAPSKLIAVGLNYADHIAEMKRTPLGTPLIWFKAPTSLLPHEGTIEIAFPEHKTDFEVELGIVIGARTKNVGVERALDHVFGYTIGEDISDRDLQTSEKQFARAKSFDTYSPVAHQPDDLSRGGNRFVRQPIADASPGRSHSQRDAFRRWPDQGRRRIRSANRRLAAAAQSRGECAARRKIMLPSRNLLTLSYIPRRMMMRTTFVAPPQRRNDIQESFARLALVSFMRIPNSSESAVGTIR